MIGYFPSEKGRIYMKYIVLSIYFFSWALFSVLCAISGAESYFPLYGVLGLSIRSILKKLRKSWVL